MNTQKHMVLAVLMLVCQACTAPAMSTHREPEIAATRTGAETRILLSKLPSLVLKKVAGMGEQLRSDETPGDWRLRRGAGGKLTDQHDRIVIKGSADVPLVGVELAPGGERWLVHHGSGRYAIYESDGTHVQDIPRFEFQDASSITWRWKDASSLVGITELSPNEKLPRYPDSDVRPSATLLFLYRLESDGDTLYALKAPEPSRGTVVRLDGVTPQGALVLSATVPEEYFGGMPEQQLGVYEVE